MASLPSQAAVDLSALDPESVSSSSTPPANRHISKVMSEDIDGPSDFTQDMGRWLNRAQSQPTPVVHSPTQYSISLSALEPRSTTSTPVASRHITNVMSDDIEGPSDFTENMGLWLQHRDSLKDQLKKSAEFSPLADKAFIRHARQASKSTSQTQIHQKSLSATMEEYNSPLPLRRVDTDHTSQKNTNDHTSPKDTNDHRPSSPTIPPEDSPLRIHIAPSKRPSSPSIGEQIASLQARCQELQRAKTVLETELKAQQAACEKDAEAHKIATIATTTKEKQLAQEVQKWKIQAEWCSQELQQRNEDLNAGIEKQQSLQREIDQLSARLEGHITSSQRSRSPPERKTITATSQSERIEEQQPQLGLNKRAGGSVEVVAGAREEKLAQVLGEQRQRLETLPQRTQDTELQLPAKREEDENRRAECPVAEHKLAQQAAKWKQRAQEGLQKLDKLESHPGNQRSYTSNNSSASALEEKAQEAEKWKHLYCTLEKTADRLEQQMATQALEHDKHLAALREEYDGVAKDVDAWVIAKVKEAEDHYAASKAQREKMIVDRDVRIKELERQYALCGKELMLAWGREEFGPAVPGQKQKYRYRF